MPDYDVVITALSPLAFSESKPGRHLPAKPVLRSRGDSARGVSHTVAAGIRAEASMLHRSPQADCAFCEALVAEETGARFSNAYPVQDPGETPLVLPASAVACKNHGRFPEFPEDDGHPVFDTLIERLCWDRLAPPGLPYVPTCPVCGERVETFRGVYAETAAGPRSRRVQQRQLTRVAINRRRNVAEEGMLYSPFVVDEVTALDRPAKEREAEPRADPLPRPHLPTARIFCRSVAARRPPGRRLESRPWARSDRDPTRGGRIPRGGRAVACLRQVPAQ